MVPWESVQFAVEALRNGASYRDAAKAAGLDPFVFEVMRELGSEGVEPWSELTAILHQADYLSMQGTIETRKELSEQGNPGMMKRFEKYKDPEQFGEIYADERPAVATGGGIQLPGGLNVQIAQFASPPEKKELPEPREIGPVLEAGNKELE